MNTTELAILIDKLETEWEALPQIKPGRCYYVAEKLLESEAVLAANQVCDVMLLGADMLSLTCFEANTFADLFRALGRDDDADKWIEVHATSDEPGDLHYVDPEAGL